VSQQDTLTSAPYIVPRPEGGASRPPVDDSEPTALPALGDLILAHRWAIVAIALTSALVVAVRVLLTPRTYTSSTSFILQGNKAAGGLAGFAAQLGLSAPTGESWHQPAFYADLVRTREVLAVVANGSYCEPCGPRRVEQPLARILGVQTADDVHHQEQLIGLLRGAVTTAVSPRTGVVTLRVASRSPSLSQQLAQRMVEGVVAFNMEMRQSQASAERQFTERRLQEVAGQLRMAELELQNFLRTNRSYQGSPELRFRERQLSRNVDLRQEVYVALARAHEQARIEEVRDTPVVAVVERPNLPLGPDPRGTFLKVAFGAALGAVAGALFFFLRSLRRMRAQRQTRSLRV
jgi:uncharacterized protein involved in exopolysaccharide biosynthesis